jgi:hypothetical protein
VGLGDGYQMGFSPDTVASELLSADMASTRWLDLLATDAAQADSAFSLAPSPTPVSDETNRFDEPVVAPTVANTAVPHGFSMGASGVPEPSTTKEVHAWQLDHDIVLQNHEALLFRTFADRAALWVSLDCSAEVGQWDRMTLSFRLITNMVSSPA